MRELSFEFLEAAMLLLEAGEAGARLLIHEVWMHEKYSQPFSEPALEKLAEMKAGASLHLIAMGVKLP